MQQPHRGVARSLPCPPQQMHLHNPTTNRDSRFNLRMSHLLVLILLTAFTAAHPSSALLCADKEGPRPSITLQVAFQAATSAAPTSAPSTTFWTWRGGRSTGRRLRSAHMWVAAAVLPCPVLHAPCSDAPCSVFPPPQHSNTLSSWPNAWLVLGARVHVNVRRVGCAQLPAGLPPNCAPTCFSGLLAWKVLHPCSPHVDRWRGGSTPPHGQPPLHCHMLQCAGGVAGVLLHGQPPPARVHARPWETEHRGVHAWGGQRHRLQHRPEHGAGEGG